MHNQPINQQVIALIPHYNHSNTVGAVAHQLRQLNLPVLIIDDGSTADHKAALQELAQQDGIQVHFCPQNGGKGAAMKVGFKLAWEQGFAYAVQVDADGQHQLSDVAIFLQKSAENPTALICGRPIYGDDAPKSRLYGRKITDFWNAIHTHSRDILDGMCGFRLYPVVAMMDLLKQEKIGDRMDFDIEIIVKAHWYQIPMVWVDTPVRYDKNGTSHFRAFADNWKISKMHTKLFWQMVWRMIRGKPL